MASSDNHFSRPGTGYKEMWRAKLTEARLDRLCGGECYNPPNKRKIITHLEVVRITPQTSAGESMDDLIQGPWSSFECKPDENGRSASFTDEEFTSLGRNSVYYVRAEPLVCDRDDNGRCLEITSHCFDHR